MNKILTALIVAACCITAASADMTNVGRMWTDTATIGNSTVTGKSSVESGGGGFSTQGSPISMAQIFAGTGNRFRVNATRPEIHGPCVMLDSDLTFLAAGTGPVIQSPNGTKYRLTVDDAGALSTVVVP